MVERDARRNPALLRTGQGELYKKNLFLAEENPAINGGVLQPSNRTFSIKSTDKRNHVRIQCEVPFYFVFSGHTVSAKTVDISESGMGIKLVGIPNIPVGEVLDILLPEIDFYSKAKVVWWKSYHSDVGLQTRFGVKFL